MLNFKKLARKVKETNIKEWTENNRENVKDVVFKQKLNKTNESVNEWKNKQNKWNVKNHIKETGSLKKTKREDNILKYVQINLRFEKCEGTKTKQISSIWKENLRFENTL